MKNNLIVAALLFLSTQINSQTNISGTVSGSLTLQGSPYHVQGHLMIAPNTTLTVMPGVTVQMEGHFKINVQGVLSARGTINDTIFFKMNPSMQNTGWWGIRFELTPSSQDSSVIEYCNISGGMPTGIGDDIKGGGIYVRSFSKLRISHNLIHNNSGDFGGGIYLYASNVLIDRNKITHNTESHTLVGGGGGGILCDSTASARIINNEISFNSNLFGGSGGGIFFRNFTGLASGNNIHHNSCDYVGGGISYINSSAGTFSNNQVNYNSGTRAGGIHIYHSNPDIISNTISNNTASGSSEYGGAILVDEFAVATVLISKNLISFNKAYNGGGISVDGGPVALRGNTIHANNGTIGGGIALNIAWSDFTNNIITNNNAEKGGGIYTTFANPIVCGNVIANNTAVENGGGLYLDNSSPHITNSDIVNNNANTLPSYTTYLYGGAGIFCTAISSPTIINSIIRGNVAQSGNGNQLYLEDNGSDPWIIHTNLQSGTQGIYTNGSVYSGSFTANQDTDPMFVNPAVGSGTLSSGLSADWRLQSGSPSINTGNPDTSGLLLPILDLYGNPRIRAIIDQGSFESGECGTFEVKVTVHENGATLSAQYSGKKYQWLNCNNLNPPFPADTFPVFTPTVNGSYKLRLIQFGCAYDSPCIQITTVGLKELTGDNLNIYPNPSTGEVTLVGIEPGSRVKVVNNLGQIVGSYIFDTQNADLLINSPGLYFIHVELHDRSFVQKIIISQK